MKNPPKSSQHIALDNVFHSPPRSIFPHKFLLSNSHLEHTATPTGAALILPFSGLEPLCLSSLLFLYSLTFHFSTLILYIGTSTQQRGAQKLFKCREVSGCPFNAHIPAGLFIFLCLPLSNALGYPSTCHSRQPFQRIHASN